MESGKFNELPPDYDGDKLGPQKRRTVFDTIEEKITHDAKNLIAIARAQFKATGVEIKPIAQARRKDDDLSALSAAIDREQGTVNPRQLTPEQIAETLHTLELRFNSKDRLKRHKGIEWTRVKDALIASPEALWSINRMEAQGHEPDVYFADGDGFDVGTCSAETPVQGRNCVYDSEDENWLKEYGMDRYGSDFVSKVNGNAVDMAKELGVEIMSPDQLNKLHRGGDFDLNTSSYIRTDATTRKSGDRLVSYGHKIWIWRDLHTSRWSSHRPLPNRSWRGSLRVNWVF